MPDVASHRPGPSRKRQRALWSATVAARHSPNVYFEEEPGRRSAAKLLSKDEARRIAVNGRLTCSPKATLADEMCRMA